ncbi:hypothetical protein DOY81_015537 [Sarcophaga bullata]|nr:hypothetical protein DOY81_015537 [Sarcophaga bullata]
MFRLLCIIIFITSFGSNRAQELLGIPIPHSDCPMVDDLKHVIMLPYPHDCSKYYSCLKGYAYLQQCPNNLQWSTLTYRCDYPDVAKCQTALTKPNTPPSTYLPSAGIPSIPVQTNPNEIIYELYPLNCDKYYKCQLKRLFLRPQSDISPLPLATSELKYLPYRNDCSKFYECQAMTCPTNYHWSVLHQQCVPPQLASCTNSPDVPLLTPAATALPSTAITAFTAPPTSSIIAPTPATPTDPGDCAECFQLCANSLHQYLPYPYNCHKFIQCNGLAFIHTCPE